ncbi:hypothetical protein [Paenarthrobacter sp. A20]|uniref:hypothetical protein n=1 Tax=Paenarthrobacter sp. A20 TaxID=2817891 RepID=UPI00209CB7A9|nr:hypothetical protein [Paenarthrobacter sp. A20]MCP1413582.1 hypothetical protein [Paenarthrobacter sp. A20]
MKHKGDQVEVSGSPLNILDDGVIWSSDVMQGRGIPVLIVDARERPDIQDLFSLQQDLGRYGNVGHAWARGTGSVLRIFLSLEFIDPVATQVVVEFDLAKQQILIDFILKAECFFLQAGKPGDRSSDDMPRILVEVLGSGEFEKVWVDLRQRLTEGQFRAKGISRSKRKQLAASELKRRDELVALRMKGQKG